MHKLFNGKLKYLFLIPMILLIGFAIFFARTYDKVQHEILSEKINEKIMAVDMTSVAVDKYIELNIGQGTYDYMYVVTSLTEKIGEMQDAFIAVYDDQHNIMSEQFGDPNTNFFDPLIHEEFLDAIKQKQFGDLKLIHDNGQSKSIPINVYFRWIPTNKGSTERCLVVVGVSLESVTTNAQNQLIVAMAAQTVISFLTNMGFVILLCLLGYIYDSRKGKKWRSAL